MTQEPLNRVGEHFSKHWTKYLQGILVFIGGIIVRERGRIKVGWNRQKLTGKK